MAQLLAALATDRPIGYNANLARAAGDAKAGLLLSQLLYWTRVGVEIESSRGWITKSRDQWSHETGLSRCEQESARLVLLEAGLIEESRVGMPSKLAFRVCLPELSSALARLLKAEPVQWSLFDVRSNADQVRALLGRNMAFYRVYTEITGSVTQAIFMARAMQAERALANSNAHSDWFTFSPAAWAIETGLTQAQLRTGKQNLCQSNLIEQALMQYPKRRTVLRMRFNELTAAVLSQRLARMNDGKAVGGLLGAIARRPQDEDQATAIKVPVSAPQALSPAKSHQQENRRVLLSNEGGSPFWRSISGGNTSPFWRTYAEADTKCLETLCSEDSTGLDGGFSHAAGGPIPPETPVTLENPQASFDTSVGRFSHACRQVFTSLHAGAQFLTTEVKTTTPPTPSSLITSNSAPGWPAQTGGGGGVELLPSDHSVHQAGQQTSAPIWPETLNPAMLQAIEQMVQSNRVARALAPERLQLLLDELAAVAARGQLRSPTAYLASLLSKEDAGTLELALAYEWQARRQARAQAAAAAPQATNEGAAAGPRGTSGDVQDRQHRAQSAQTVSAPVADALAQKHWEATLAVLQPIVGASQMQLWLAPLVPVAIEAGQIVLLCSSRFKLDHIKRSHLAAMNDALVQVMSSDFGYQQEGQAALQWGFRLVTSFQGR